MNNIFLRYIGKIYKKMFVEFSVINTMANDTSIFATIKISDKSNIRKFVYKVFVNSIHKFLDTNFILELIFRIFSE